MSILIKGMEMPFVCQDCFFNNHARCCALPTSEFVEFNKRRKDCPLVPVPPRRLIDADALKMSLVFSEKTAKWAVPVLRAVLMVIDETPTIIEAEDGE